MSSSGGSGPGGGLWKYHSQDLMDLVVVAYVDQVYPEVHLVVVA